MNTASQLSGAINSQESGAQSRDPSGTGPDEAISRDDRASSTASRGPIGVTRRSLLALHSTRYRWPGLITTNCLISPSMRVVSRPVRAASSVIDIRAYCDELMFQSNCGNSLAVAPSKLPFHIIEDRGSAVTPSELTVSSHS